MTEIRDMRDDEIDVRKLFSVLLNYKKFILLFIGSFQIIGLIYSLFLNNVYTAKTIFVPTVISQNTPTNDSLNLASIAGFKVGDKDPNVEIGIAYINSIQIVEKLTKYDSFLPDLLASINWDLKSNRLYYDKNLFNHEQNKWVRKAKTPFGIIPSSQEAHKVFSKLVKISESSNSNLIILTVDHISPFVAQQWSLWIAKEVNQYISSMRVAESQKAIAYLDEQIKSTPYSELRSYFYELIQQKTQNMMLAKSNPEFVFTTIQPPLVAENFSKPNRVLLILLFVFIGLVVSITLVFFMHFLLTPKLNSKIHKKFTFK
jgi:uncharacterized protein involved in exopolysaccharide biosynthesis